MPGSRVGWHIAALSDGVRRRPIWRWLLGRPPAWVDEADLQNLRRSAEEFSAAVADSAALVERIKLLQEELAGFAIILAVVTILTVAGGLIALRRKEW